MAKYDKVDASGFADKNEMESKKAQGPMTLGDELFHLGRNYGEWTVISRAFELVPHDQLLQHIKKKFDLVEKPKLEPFSLGPGQVVEIQEDQQPSQEELIEMWDRGYELGRAHQRERDSDLREAGIVL